MGYPNAWMPSDHLPLYAIFDVLLWYLYIFKKIKYLFKFIITE